MELTRLLNFSLDLNAKPVRRFLQKEEVPESSFIGLRLNSSDTKDALIENKKLSELLAIATDLLECSNNYNTSSSRKRKADIQVLSLGPSHSSSSSDEESSSSKKQRGDQIKPKISRLCLRTEASDKTLIVKDGYQWRKYGQKVTRDNPCPRAYFKCSFAPTCPVKKKVQRSVEDQSVVVATYEGEHNHPQPAKVESTTTSTSNKSSILGSSTAALDFTKPKPVKEETINVDALQHYFVEKMASTLTKDPNFRAALVAAISGKFLQSNSLTEIVDTPRVMK